jgi:phosphopentomutase
MDKLVAANKDVYAVGKIDDLFGGRGITHTAHSANNEQALKDLIEKFMPVDFEGLLFVNLVEFDMIYGHRNDPQGYAAALQAFDRRLPEIQALMRDDDIAIISADHGVDPTTPSTDHSREYVPLLVFGKQVRPNINLGTRKTFSDVGATIAEIFSLEKPEFGESFLSEIQK